MVPVFEAAKPAVSAPGRLSSGADAALCVDELIDDIAAGGEFKRIAAGAENHC
jgi:hypothetical protein